jgi:hypothetical protein
MRYLKKFKAFENLHNLGDIFEFDKTNINDNNLKQKWINGEKIMNDGLFSGNYDDYEEGYKIMAEVLLEVGFSEEEVESWKESKSDSFDNY